MMSLQSRIEKKLEELAEDFNEGEQRLPFDGREVVVSNEFANVGTYHLLDQGKHIRQLDFRFAHNYAEFERETPNSYYFKHRFHIGEDWDKLMKFLEDFVTKKN